MSWVECQIAWSGIDKDGHRVSSRFCGTLKTFKHYCQQQHIIYYQCKPLIIMCTPLYQLKLQRRFFALLDKLLSQGYLITTALELMAIQCKADDLAPSIQILQSGLASGLSLSQSLKQCKHLHNHTADQLIQAGEQSQQLAAIIQRLHAQQAFQQETQAQLKQALIYPLCVLIGAIGLTAGLLTFAIPQFATIFNNFDAKLPWATQQLLDLSQGLNQHWSFIFCVTMMSTLAIALSIKHPATRARLIRVSRRLPLIGKIITARLQSDWATIFTHCLHAALPLTTSLQLANDTLGGALTPQQKITLQDKLQEGDSIRDICAALHLYPAQTLTEIDLHARSGDLAHGFSQIAKAAHHNLKEKITSLSKWIEPVIMMILAIITGGLIITLYLPIFKLGSVL